MHASAHIRGTNDGCGGPWGVRFRTIRATRQPVISPGSPGDTVASITTPHDSPGDTVAGITTPHDGPGDTVASTTTPHDSPGRMSADTTTPHDGPGRMSAASPTRLCAFSYFRPAFFIPSLTSNHSFMKRAIALTYSLVVATMATATWIEHFRGTEFVARHLYGAWWFTLLWALLAALGVAWIVKRRVRRWSTLLVHAAFVVILLGALLTHLTASRGIVHLRQGATVDTYLAERPDGSTEERRLPFRITLDSFRVHYHAGTTAERDYTSHFTVSDGQTVLRGETAMNRIFTFRSVRLYQSAYDPDMAGSYLAVNTDPYGIPITYTGYGLLFAALVGLLIDPHGTFRRLLSDARLRRGAFLALVLLSIGREASADPLIVPRETADRFGRLHLLYSDRIAPVQTFAIDFTKKLYGRASYRGLTAEQVLMGRLFDPRGWDKEPMIRVKDAALRRQLRLPRYASVNHFFSPDRGYILGTYLMEYEQGQRDAFHTACVDMDAKIRLIMSLRDGSALALFPHADVYGAVRWRHPATPLSPGELPRMDALFLRSYLSLLREQIVKADYGTANTLIEKLDKYQRLHAGGTLPSPMAERAERLTNAFPFATVLFIVNLTVGLLALLYTIRRLVRRHDAPRTDRLVRRTTLGLLLLSFAALTLCEVLRWIVAGRAPVANGYETMLLIAWFTLLFAFVAGRRFPITLPFGALISGFFLLVSHLALMDPRITPLMPVLGSPLLSLHVSVIMMAYALLSLTFICALTALLLAAIGRRDPQRTAERMDALRLLSLLFLYPALVTLGVGIFVGAIWANVSWGTYWSWDPKETWALITFMVYAVVVHTHTWPAFRRPMAYHVYLLLSFLTLLMTYFGVNYLLGGMHSYA